MADGLTPPCGKAADIPSTTTAVVGRRRLHYYRSRSAGGGVTWHVTYATANSLTLCLAYTYARRTVDRESAGRGAGGILPTSGDTLAPCNSHPLSWAPSLF